MGPFLLDNADPFTDPSGGGGDSGFPIDPNSILPGDSGGPANPLWALLQTLVGRIPLPGGRIPLQLPAGGGGNLPSVIPPIIRAAGGAVAGLSRSAKVLAALAAAGVATEVAIQVEKLFTVDKNGNLMKRRHRRKGITGAQLHGFTRVAGFLNKYCVTTHRKFPHVRTAGKKKR